jgi:DNA-binding transcriptional LysR family regulator
MHSPLARLPPLDPLRGFVAAAHHLSFTRAAEELFLTQSAISRQVQALEAALGVTLFVRGIRSLSLTPEGARLFAAAEGWLDDYARLADALRAAGPRPVTVTSSIGIAALWLVPRLTRFQALHPDIDVRLAAGNRLVDLTREGIDLAMRYCADRDAPPGAERLFGETVLPVACPALAARGLDRHTLPDTVLLEFDDPGYPWLRWQDWLAAMGLGDVRPRAMLGFNHYDQLIHAAVAGQGIALGRAELVGQLLADGRLGVIDAGRREVAGRGFWLITAPGVPRPEVARFAEWLRAEAGAGAGAGAMGEGTAVAPSPPRRVP